jgi:hypothetical protein
LSPRVACLLALLGVAACGPTEVQGRSSAPVNACSASPCSAYSPVGTASCDQGACVVTASLSGVRLVIELASDAYFAPGRTFVVSHDSLYDNDDESAKCVQSPCGRLPEDGVVLGNYVMSACVQSAPSICPGEGVDWNLGNNAPGSDLAEPTALPVSATFRLLKDPSQDDVVSLGLPVESVQAQSDVNPGAEVGPAGGPNFAFQTYLEPGTYERTLLPEAPFNTIFGPEVTTLEVLPGMAAFEHDIVNHFDVTKETGMGPTLPTFDIARADGLDGWTAYLRDATTLETISNVRPLSGTLARGVLLVTNHLAVNHVPTGMDALANAELVVEPPASTPMPRGVFAPFGTPGAQQLPELPAQETYPALPRPVSFGGNVVSADGSPIAADLVFEALAITDQKGNLNVINFEFVGSASAQPSSPGGDSVYAVVLPPGQYRVDVRPLDMSGAVTIVNLLVGEPLSMTTKTFSVDALSPVQGTARAADDRALSGATIEALPTQCFALAAADAEGGAPAAGATPASSTSCLPRPGQATVSADGSFKLALDPGSYLLRARPVDGTRLPWVTKSLTVEPSATSAPQSVNFVVPAPTPAGLQLFDPVDNPIVHAVVRAFALPTQPSPATSPPAPAIELGRAITDTNGRFDLYLALPTP